MYPGLQVLINDKWESIQPVENAIVVNMGNLLSRISGGRVKATMHQVYDIGKERFSAPFFFSPKYSARISDNIMPSERKLVED